MPLTRHLRTAASAILRRDSTDHPAISDEQYRTALSHYVALADRVLNQPERWLGLSTHHRIGPRAARVLSLGTRGLFGRVQPGSPRWDRLNQPRRVRWWTRRIALTAGAAAAAPHLGGVIASRFPLQDALGASAAGLAVCATARENGQTDPATWVPLLATVIFDRDLNALTPPALTTTAAEQDLATDDRSDAAGTAVAQDAAGAAGSGPARQAARSMWRLARALVGLQSAFDERPRGGRLARAVGLVPVVGVLGGWFDERGAIRRAAARTQKLIDAAAAPPR